MTHLLLPTDVFPPKCGGAGWSAHALARALIARGHAVTAYVPKLATKGFSQTEVLGVLTWTRGYYAPKIPFVQNYFRHEQLWPRMAHDLVQLAQSASAADLVIHAQHVQVAPAAVLAAERLRVPAVVTIRDHWPWDYFATGMFARQDAMPQTWADLALDVQLRIGPLRGTAALLAIPYIHAHMQQRQAYLRRASAVVAVSEYMAKRLRSIVDPARIHVVPNMVDLRAVEALLRQPAAIQMPQVPFLLYVGKLEANKGAQQLPAILAAIQSAGVPHIPLVIAGDGVLKLQLATELAGLGIETHFLEWVEHDQVLQLMAQCSVLLYPSAWGEPLSRVLLEACACGAPIAAMATGGTADIVSDGENGVLAASPEALGRRAAQIVLQPLLRQHLAAGAIRVARRRFAVDVVIGQFEALYAAL
jgi:glycogen synthase